MPEKDDDAGKLDQTDEILDMILISNDQATEVIKPGEQSFHPPSSLETTQRATVLGLTLCSAPLTMWCNHLGTELLKHLLIQPIAIVGFVSDQSLGHLCNEALL